MIPGELFIKDGDIELNAGRKTVTLTVANTGDCGEAGKSRGRERWHRHRNGADRARRRGCC